MFLSSDDNAETHSYTHSYTQDIDNAGGRFNDRRRCSRPLHTTVHRKLGVIKKKGRSHDGFSATLISSHRVSHGRIWNSRTREWKRRFPLTSPVRPVPLFSRGLSFLQRRTGQDCLPRSRWQYEPTCSLAGDASPDQAVQMRRLCFRPRQKRQERFGAFSQYYGNSIVSLSSDKTTGTREILSRHSAFLRSHVSGRSSLLSAFSFVHVLHFTRAAEMREEGKNLSRAAVHFLHA